MSEETIEEKLREAANIAKISGIPIANIGTVKGIAI